PPSRGSRTRRSRAALAIRPEKTRAERPCEVPFPTPPHLTYCHITVKSCGSLFGSYGGSAGYSTTQEGNSDQLQFYLLVGRAAVLCSGRWGRGEIMIDAANGALEIVLRNDLAEIERLASLVEGFCETRDIPLQAAYHLNLVLDELVTNIVSYGYDEG